MSDASGRFPVEIYYSDDDERNRAKKLLDDIGSDEVIEYDGVVEGTADIDAVEYLGKCGLHVYFPEGIPSEEAELSSESSPDSLFPKSPYTDARDLDVLRKFSARATYIDLDSDALDVMPKSYGCPTVKMRESPREDVNPLLDGIDTDGLERAPRNLPDEEEMMPEDAYRILLSGKMRSQWRKNLAEEGINILQQEQLDLYDVFLTKEQLTTVQKLPFVRAVKRYGLKETVTPHMLKILRDQLKEQEDFAMEEDFSTAPRTFDVILHRYEDLDQVKALIESSMSAKILDASRTLIRIEADTDSPLLAALANLPYVRSISPYEPPALMCDFVRNDIGVTVINKNPVGAPGRWDGEGETVAVIDSGIDKTHPDLAESVQTTFGVGMAVDEFGHGTHVAGIIAGTGAASDGQIKGIAPAAKIVSIGIRTDTGLLDLPADWGKLLKKANDEGAKIINLSLGRQFKGEYQTEAESVDRFCLENPDVLVVVAAGNEGEARDGHHKLNTVGMPASAKNVITVGASASSRPGNETWGQRKPSNFPNPPASDEPVTGNPQLVAALSSRGPTDSKQVKPDVVAPGTNILSARANGATVNFKPDFDDFGQQYAFLSGTSMATPVVSGAAAIIRQYLRDELNKPNPSAALLKAILIASADRLPATPGAISPEEIGHPDFEQGFGRINLSNVMPLDHCPARKLYMEDVLKNTPEALAARRPVGADRKSKRHYKFRRDDTSQGPVKVVLAWTDEPGRFVQNDLQLSVKIPGGEKQLGNNQHRAFAPPWAAAAGMDNFDLFNTVEIVTIDDPLVGTYRITIFAQDTPYPPQGYALCVVGDLSDKLTEGV
jgi:hypothetical protein